MPIFLSSQKIVKDWIDYNNHMNVSYYLLIFDKYGADILNDTFKMGEHSAKTTGKSTMIVELNNRKVSEFEGDKLEIMDNYIKNNIEKFDNTNLKFSSKLKK